MTETALDVLQVTSWLWCLRTPVVQAYAVRHGDGFNLIDTGTAGSHEPILQALAHVDRRPVDEIIISDILLTHGHDDHTGSGAALVARTNARVLAPEIDTPIIEGERPARGAARRVGDPALRADDAARPARSAGARRHAPERWR